MFITSLHLIRKITCMSHDFPTYHVTALPYSSCSLPVLATTVQQKLEKPVSVSSCTPPSTVSVVLLLLF